jgi:extracellular elastinolytic metalloproteinase
MARFRQLISGLLLLALLAGGSSGFAQTDDNPRRQQNPGYIVQGSSPGQAGDTSFLTGPQRGDPLLIAQRYLQQNVHLLGLTGADLLDVVVTDQYTDAHNGVTHIYMRQRFKGIDVANGDLSINIAADGSVINVGHSFVTNLAAAVNRQAPRRTAPQAVAGAARHLGLTLTQAPQVLSQPAGDAQEMLFDEAGISQEPIPARLVYQPVGPDRVRLAWQLDIYELSSEHFWSMIVDADTGEVLAQHDYIDHDNWDYIAAGPTTSRNNALLAPQARVNTLVDGAVYNVFAMPLESPNDGPRTLVVDPAHPIASPFGWHDTNGEPGPEFTRTRGNNVHAYTDIDANNVADPGSDPDGGPGLVFDFPLDLGQNPSTYRDAAVTNLFYWNNIIHDVFYGYGFNELSGNFQVNNYGRGPTTPPLGANDDVRAEAQDGSGTNNANFLTPADGSRPRMQMFIWTYPFVNLVTVNPPSPIAGDYSATNAAFGPQLTAVGPIIADVVLALDPSNAAGPSETDGCSPLTNAAEVAGKIALLDRGTCPFVDKVTNAQNAGAIAVIVANNAPGSPIVMGGAAPAITIPSVMISLDNGNLLKANLPLNATLSDAGDLAINRDSDLDNGVIVHEYGHGISNRLTGGRTNVSCLGNQEQMGEGWSDWLGLVLTTHPDDLATTPRGIGTYVIYQPTDGNGIRPTPYTTDMSVNPSTYDTIKNPAITVPHGVGYVWSTMLWDVYWNLVNKHGYNPDVYGDWSTGGNNLAIQLVIDGMKLQPCQPGFVTGRNAILQADEVLTDGANQCEIWQGFARRGLGYSASQGSSNNRNDGVEAFDLPASCVNTLSLETPAATQYSDPVTLSASVSPPLYGGLPVTGSVEFFIEGVSVGASDLDGSGVAELTVPNDRAAGNYSVTASFTPSGPEGVGASNASPVTLVVTKEKAASTYTGDLFVTTAGPNVNSAPVVLSANLVQEDDGYPGDIALARVLFELYKSGNMGSTPDQTVGDVAVDANGNASAMVDLTADNWTVKVKIEPGNGYWTANPVGMGLITVAVGSTERRVTGGGWVPDDASSTGKGNFGFTVRPHRNGNPIGNAIFVFRGLDGFDYLVKSTSWQGGSLVFLGNPITSARFSGRATVQKIDPSTGAIVESYGNYSFIVDIHDGDLLDPRGPDAYGITVLTNNGSLFHQVGANNAPVELGGGNVAIKGN